MKRLTYLACVGLLGLAPCGCTKLETARLDMHKQMDLSVQAFAKVARNYVTLADSRMGKMDQMHDAYLKLWDSTLFDAEPRPPVTTMPTSFPTDADKIEWLMRAVAANQEYQQAVAKYTVLFRNHMQKRDENQALYAKAQAEWQGNSASMMDVIDMLLQASASTYAREVDIQQAEAELQAVFQKVVGMLGGAGSAAAITIPIMAP